MENGENQRDTTDPIHLRLRIHCKRDKTYTIESCPENKLLNITSLACEPYDICQDKANGYKHNFIINQTNDSLKENEYYLCNGNASVKSVCEEGTVLSASNAGCILKTPCFGKKNERIYVDKNNYIQCAGNVEKMIHCVFGVKREPNIECFTKLCNPSVLYKESSVYKYATESIVCKG